MPLNIAIGCTRVSTAAQAREYGPQTQSRDIGAEALRLGLTLEQTIHETESGAREDRETLETYYRLAQERPGLHFIFPRVDRIGRRADLILGIVHRLESLGAVVHAVGVPMRLDSKEGKLLLTLLSAMSEFDHANIRDNLRNGKLRKALEGRWPHSRPPYGYRMDPDVPRKLSMPIPLEPGASTVRRAFELVSEMGLMPACKTLEQEGHLPSRGGAHWDSSSLRNIISNPIYKGVFEFGRLGKAGGVVVPVPVPALISAELWEAANTAMKGRHRAGRQPSGAYLLTGHLECVTCGRAVGVLLDRGRVYYRCYLANVAVARNRGQETCPERTYHPADSLEHTVWAYLLEHLPDPVRLGLILGQDEQRPDHSSEKAALLEAIKRTGLAYSRGYLTEAEMEAEAAPHKARLRELEALERAGPVRIDAVEASQRLGAAMRGLETLEQKRGFLKAAGVRVRVGPGGVVGVRVRV